MDFTHDPSEATAITSKVYDKNNETCALIIVENVDVGGYKFSFKNAWSKAEEKKSDGKKIYMVYVSPGVKGISISNIDTGIEPLKYYTFPQKIEKGKTYHIRLGQVFKSSDTAKQYVQFSVFPENSILEVDGNILKLTNGLAEELMKYGTYSYKVSAPDYHKDAGTFTVNSKNVQKLNIRLHPNFGWVDIEGGADLEGASIIIDDELKGTGSSKAIRLRSGRHVLKIAKENYKPLEIPFEITDSLTTKLAPTLIADFSTTTLTVDNEAEIWMDGKLLGKGEWRGPIKIGDYIVQ